MALPAGILTKMFTFGPGSDDWGVPIGGSASFTPSRSRVWTATGAPIYIATKTVVFDGAGNGSVQLICTDQPGFQDGAGNPVTNWTYQVRLSVAGANSPAPFSLAVPMAAVEPIDLDLTVPVPSSVGSINVPNYLILSVGALSDADITALGTRLNTGGPSFIIDGGDSDDITTLIIDGGSSTS